MKKSLFALLATAVASSAASVYENQNLLESKVDSINAKRGVEFGGSIRGVAQASYFDTDQDVTSKNRMPDVEKNEFVTGDLDFHFRPYENVRANAMIRLEAGMQEYFASAAKSISVEWINVEGNIGKSFYWIVGDFRQQYTPLTLFMPGVDIMYEPMIFARQRHMAQKSQLIEGNQRNLQGVNLQFRMPSDILGEIRAEGLFARLNRNAVLDLFGAEGNIMPNTAVSGASMANNMDKWLGAANVELFPMQKNVYAGFTGMYIFDDNDSYSYTERHDTDESGDYSVYSDYHIESINPYDVDAQKTLVISGRVGGDVAGIMGNKNLTLDVTGEVAMSNDKVYTHTPTYKTDATGNFVQSVDEYGDPATDEAGNPIYETDDVVTNESLSGMAILGTVNAGYKTDAWGVQLGVNIIYNDSNWFNNAAQSPSFFAQRILNSDLDGNTVKYGVNSPLYSTFDALYNFSPKFSPVSRSLGTDDGAFNDGQTESYSIANYNKNSWTTNVYTRSQLALLETLDDPTLQMSLPNGLATSNRVGAQANLVGNFSDFLEVQGLFSTMSQVSPLLGFKDVSYTEFGGGLKVDVFKALGFSKPLELSGSYKHSVRKSDLDAAVYGVEGSGELNTNFINAGFYAQYLPRLGVTAGLQYITTEYNDVQANISGMMAPLMKGNQMQWMAGLDYTVEKNAWLSLNVGMITVSNEYNTSKVVASNELGVTMQAGTSSGVYNLPEYYDVTKDGTGTYKHEFSQMILEASLNVEF